MNAPPYGLQSTAPQLDLYAIAKSHAWSKLWVSIGCFLGGIVLRWAATPLPYLAQEVDRRRYALGGG